MTYDPDLIAAIRQARADLFVAQQERRRVYILTNVPPQQKHKAVSDVQRARSDLDAARAMALETSTPEP